MTPDSLPSLAELLAEADRVEHDALALSRSFPRAVGRVLHLAARAGALNRRALDLNGALTRAGAARRLAEIAPTVPLGVADALWRAVLDTVPVDGDGAPASCDGREVSDARHAPAQRLRDGCGTAAGRRQGAQGQRSAARPTGAGPSRRGGPARAGLHPLCR